MQFNPWPDVLTLPDAEGDIPASASILGPLIHQEKVEAQIVVHRHTGAEIPYDAAAPAVEEDDGASGLSRRDPPGMEPQAVIAGEVQVPGLLLPEPIHSVFHQSRITGSDFLPQGVVVLPGVFMPPDAGDAKYQVTANHSQQAQGPE